MAPPFEFVAEVWTSEGARQRRREENVRRLTDDQLRVFLRALLDQRWCKKKKARWGLTARKHEDRRYMWLQIVNAETANRLAKERSPERSRDDDGVIYGWKSSMLVAEPSA
jgi:hypothetical protein